MAQNSDRRPDGWINDRDERKAWRKIEEDQAREEIIRKDEQRKFREKIELDIPNRYLDGSRKDYIVIEGSKQTPFPNVVADFLKDVFQAVVPTYIGKDSRITPFHFIKILLLWFTQHPPCEEWVVLQLRSLETFLYKNNYPMKYKAPPIPELRSDNELWNMIAKAGFNSPQEWRDYQRRKREELDAEHREIVKTRQLGREEILTFPADCFHNGKLQFSEEEKHINHIAMGLVPE